MNFAKSSLKPSGYQRVKLNDRKIRAIAPAEKPKRHSDGFGLFLEVRPNGSKLWRMAYRFDRKQKLLSFGQYPIVSLSRAREKCIDAKRQLSEGVDPSTRKMLLRAQDAGRAGDTFQTIAAEYVEKRRKEGLSKTTLQKKEWFIRLACADLGKLPMLEITAPVILIPLRKQEEKGNYETARRLRSTIGQVFRYAVATARAENDPTFALRDALITPKVQHRAAMTKRDDFANLVQTIWTFNGSSETVMTALKLMALLYTRPGELRLSYWDEFDFKAATWNIPAERMKMRREHTKPLSKPVIALLKQHQLQSGASARVFPSLTGRDRPISENTMNQALRRMSFSAEEMTSHGFRASASSLINESGLWDQDAIEAELAHADQNQVRRIYHRALYWEQRVKMADWWAAEVLSMALYR
jgi:integrase